MAGWGKTHSEYEDQPEAFDLGHIEPHEEDAAVQQHVENWGGDGWELRHAVRNARALRQSGFPQARAVHTNMYWATTGAAHVPLDTGHSAVVEGDVESGHHDVVIYKHMGDRVHIVRPGDDLPTPTGPADVADRLKGIFKDRRVQEEMRKSLKPPKEG